LGALLLSAFVPLDFAIATYTQVALRQVREEHARQLGRAIAGHVSEARQLRSDSELLSLLNAEITTESVEAIGVYDADGKALARAGEPDLVALLGTRIDPTREALLDLPVPKGSALAVVVPSGRGAVGVVIRVDDQAARVRPLLRLVALYTAVVALAALVLAYFALTRMIVRPLDALSAAAQRVAGGTRSLRVPSAGSRELTELGSSLRRMTERLIDEEDALRQKIDEVERATEDLKQAQDRLVRSERLASVGRLAAGLAHEVGNPIAALIGLQDLLLTGDLDEEEARDVLQRMRKETERIHRIIEDLLQFARPAAGRAKAAAAPGEVSEVVRDIAALVAPQKSFRDVRLEVEVSGSLPRVALGGEQLMQVLLNLVLNAADACGPGGHVRVKAYARGAHVELTVEDDGPGVSDDVVERLFEPFVTTKESERGTGLGLAVCRGLVESVNGRIWLDKGYSPGARFLVELPAA
jgi:signal transduction histidine kinase